MNDYFHSLMFVALTYQAGHFTSMAKQKYFTYCRFTLLVISLAARLTEMPGLSLLLHVFEECVCFSFSYLPPLFMA